MEESQNQTNQEGSLAPAGDLGGDDGDPQPADDLTSQQTPLSVIAYLGPLVIVSYLLAKSDPFIKYHVKQGLVLLVLEVANWILMPLLPLLWPLWQIVNLGILILIVVGIINAAGGKEKPLPFVGNWASHFKF